MKAQPTHATKDVMKIILDDLTHPAIKLLLEEHLADMRATSPPESVHALDLDALKTPDVRFFTLWQHEQLAACGALKQIDKAHEELKSMRVAANSRRQGFAVALLNHLIEDAATRGVKRISLETGTAPFFEPACRLYQNAGFTECGPFDGYQLDEHSRFMTLVLPSRGARIRI